MTGKRARGQLNWRERMAVVVASVAIRLLGTTWRIRRLEQFESLATRRVAGEPTLFAFWHGQMLPLLYQHRDEGVTLMVSSHRDGEMIARVAKRFGCGVVRGSTSRNAAGALLGLVRALADGGDAGVTPDGPRGPAREFAPGAAVASFESGAAIVLLGVAADRAWRLRSWDRFLIPKPFARVIVAYGAPWRAPGATARDAADAAPALGQQLDALIGRAEAALDGR